MRRVVLESPYGSTDPLEVEANVAYAKRCMLDCLARGDAPIASHLLWTQDGLLDDRNPEQRKAGIEAGLSWIPVADAGVFYVDRGASPGMRAAVDRYVTLGIPIEWRSLERGPVFTPNAMLAITQLSRASDLRIRPGHAVDQERAWSDFQAALRNSGAGRLIAALADRLGRK